MPLVITPLMTAVYKATIKFFPGAILLISSSLFVLIILNLGLVLYLLNTYGGPVVENGSESDEANIVDNPENSDNDDEGQDLS